MKMSKKELITITFERDPGKHPLFSSSMSEEQMAADIAQRLSVGMFIDTFEMHTGYRIKKVHKENV
jgi:hypothetical protein